MKIVGEKIKDQVKKSKELSDAFKKQEGTFRIFVVQQKGTSHYSVIGASTLGELSTIYEMQIHGDISRGKGSYWNLEQIKEETAIEDKIGYKHPEIVIDARPFQCGLVFINDGRIEINENHKRPRIDIEYVFSYTEKDGRIAISINPNTGLEGKTFACGYGYLAGILPIKKESIEKK